MSDETKSGTHSKAKKPLPTHEEIEKMVHEVFPERNAMCPGLCNELQDVIDRLDETTDPKVKARLIARLHAIGAAIKSLHCTCFPQ